MAIENVSGSGPSLTRGKASPTRTQRADLIHYGSMAAAVAGFGLAIVVAHRIYRARESAIISTNGEFVLLTVGLLAGVMALAVVLLRPESGTARAQAMTAGIWTAALVVALAIVWTHINLAPHDARNELAVGRSVLDQADVEAFLAAHLNPADGAQTALRIPTGVLLESVEFLTANNVRVTGFVWQKWPADAPSDITRGLVLPEATDIADLDTPAYRVALSDGSELIGWHVRATVRQTFDYHHYPFDRQDVWLRLWPRDFGRQVVLVPDFSSYPNMNPAAMPGLDLNFVYGGWTPEHAHFSYGATRYDATLGYTAAREAAPFPELYFNVGLKREFLEPFLDYVIFALAVAILLFAVLVLSINQQSSDGRPGFSSFSILGLTGTLLFAVILREFQLRSILDPDQIVYLEALPFLLNLAILLVAMHAILLSRPVSDGVGPRGYRSSRLPVLLYWPTLLGILLVVTLIVFFR